MNIVKLVEDSLQCCPVSATERMLIPGRDLLLPQGAWGVWIPSRRSREPLMPSGCNFVHDAPIPNPNEPNSSLVFYCQLGDGMSTLLRARLALLLRVIQQPIFNQLRTTEQLGYRVKAGRASHSATIGFRILIQGPHDPTYLEQRVEACLEQMRSLILGLDTDAFDRQMKVPCMKRLREEPRDIQQEAYRFWDRIVSGHYDFKRRESHLHFLAFAYCDC